MKIRFFSFIVLHMFAISSRLRVEKKSEAAFISVLHIFKRSAAFSDSFGHVFVGIL